MTDRDTFAAAALTGLLATGQGPYHGEDYFATAAYKAADAMLRERDKTNHDAAPAAKATADRYVRRAAADGGSDRTASEGTGNTPPPHATSTQGSVPSDGSVPDSRKWNEPVAWAVQWAGEDIDVRSVFSDRASAERHVANYHGKNSIVPLYRHPQPTLTDEEREAVEQAIDAANGMAQAEPWTIRTLRGLLERMK